MPITDPSQEYFKDGTWVWNGTAWVKASLLWGFSDRYAESIYELDATVNDMIETTAVPAGYVLVLTVVTAFNNTSTFTSLAVNLQSGGADRAAIMYQVAPVATVLYNWTGAVALQAGDTLRAYFNGNTIGDNIYLRVWGYRMKAT